MSLSSLVGLCAGGGYVSPVPSAFSPSAFSPSPSSPSVRRSRAAVWGAPMASRAVLLAVELSRVGGAWACVSLRALYEVAGWYRLTAAPSLADEREAWARVYELAREGAGLPSEGGRRVYEVGAVCEGAPLAPSRGLSAFALDLGAVSYGDGYGGRVGPLEAWAWVSLSRVRVVWYDLAGGGFLSLDLARGEGGLCPRLVDVEGLGLRAVLAILEGLCARGADLLGSFPSAGELLEAWGGGDDLL